MYVIYTRHKIKSYAQWRKAFDENSPMLAQCGINDWWIVPVNGDDTDIAVIVHSPSKKEWDAFLAMDQQKMKQSGVDPREKGGLIGQPEWWVGQTV